MARDARTEMLEAAMAADEAAASRPLGECLRVLQCFTCRTMQELPDFQGRPDDDQALTYLLVPHGSETQNPHRGALHRVEKRVWDDRAARKQVIKEMWSGESGFTPSYYDLKNTLMEDAAKCHTAHLRVIPCPDFRADSKRLASPTRKAREQLARDLPRGFAGDRDAIAKGGIVQYLCDFCPVKAAADHALRVKRGLA